jgi:hypothetical protein
MSPLYPHLQMREDAIREHLTPHPATVASNLHLAENAAQSEAAAAQSPAEAQASHAIKTAADAAKALPEINAAIEQNEREYAFSPFLLLHFTIYFLFVLYNSIFFRYAELAKSLPSHVHQQLAHKELSPQQK